MSQPSIRTERIAELIQRKLAEIIRLEIKDPRLPSLITISMVDVSKDLSHAKIYFTVFQGDPVETSVILNSAANYLRSALGRTLTTRIIPQLHFVYDESIAYGDRLSRLIDEANASSSTDNEEVDE